MRECKAPGMYGDACRSVEYCLALSEHQRGDPAANSNLLKRYNCPGEAVTEVEQDEEENKEV